MIQNTTIQEDQRRRFSLGDFEETGSKKGLTLTKQFWVGGFDRKIFPKWRILHGRCLVRVLMEKHTPIYNYQPKHDTCFCLGVGKQSDDLLGTSLELFTPPEKITNVL